MSNRGSQPRRTDRADQAAPDLMRELARLRRPIAGESELTQTVNGLVREGELYEKLPDGRVHCYACGHNCRINDGGRGICQVRFNLAGRLLVPTGYVVAFQSDPIEKKPFFHVYPGSDALTFGMLGCDLHCGYCFTGDTFVLTDRGPLRLEQLFQSAAPIETKDGAAIAIPSDLRAVSASGRLRRVEAIFEHHYRGPMTVIRPYYLPELVCTPDHRVYATDDVTRAPELTYARNLTRNHYLAIPRHLSVSEPQFIDVEQELAEHRVTYRVPWHLTSQQRQEIAAATARGETSREIGNRLGTSGSYIRHVRAKLARGAASDERSAGIRVQGNTLRFPNEHRPGIPTRIELNEQLARLLGYYCAEGSVVQSKARPNSLVVNFSFARSEEKQAQETLQLLECCLGVSSSLVRRMTTLAVVASKSSAGQLLKTLCGGRAAEKRVPRQLFQAPQDIVRAFLDAYLAGDGHRYANGKVTATTVSPHLAYGIATLALKLGYLPSIYDQATPPVGSILGRAIRRAPHQFTMVWYENSQIERRVVETEQAYLVPLRGVESREHDGPVYNLQVAEEHTYLAGLFQVSNCQNWDISQALRDASAGRPPTRVTPEQLVELGRRYGARVFASSYNEPLITSEWAVEVFRQAQAAGFACAYVSNGNATRGVLEYLRPYVSAYKVDLKSMRDKNYRQLGAPLENILEGVRLVHALGFWLEIVTLVVPGFNDSTEELRDAAQFIASISPDIPWHVTAFHQDYKMQDHANTSVAALLRACELGRAAGLHFVYAGNVPGHVGEWENTYCPNCRALLIERVGYTLLDYRITGAGTCPACGTRIPGIFSTDPGRVRLGPLDGWFMRGPRALR